MTNSLGRIGVWSAQLRRGDRERTRDAVAELDRLGYGTIWLPGGSGAEFFSLADACLAATRRIVVASGILSVWTNGAPDVAAAHAALAQRYPGRILLGLGVSHPHLVEREMGRRFEHPVAVMRGYLDALAATPTGVPRDELVLAALGPRMLALARDRAWGAHPYFVLLRLGFREGEFADGGSDRLVDAVVAWGDVAAIGRRIEEHQAAGADHVCIQVIAADPDALPLAEWQTLATGISARGCSHVALAGRATPTRAACAVQRTAGWETSAAPPPLRPSLPVPRLHGAPPATPRQWRARGPAGRSVAGPVTRPGRDARGRERSCGAVRRPPLDCQAHNMRSRSHTICDHIAFR